MSQQGSASNGFGAGGADHAVLVGTGTPAITSVGPGAVGTVLIGNGSSADPSFSASPSVTSITISNAPVSGTDGANKTYVDSVAMGLNIQPSCYAGSTATLNATYANGAAGVGATLTNAGAQAAFSIDGTTPSLNARILIKNQSSNVQNGIYTLTTVGTGATNWVLTRATDYDTPAEIQPGDLVIVQNGSTNANSSWIQLDTVTAIGTDPVQFSQFTADPSLFVKSLTGNSGGAISPTGNNINLLGTGSITISGSGSTLTTQLTGITNHAIQIGAGTATLTQLGAGTTGQILQTNTTADPTWSSATYPSSVSANTILYASSSNVISTINSANSAILFSNSSGVPAFSSSLTDGQLMIGATGANPTPATLTAGSGISITNGSASITISATGGTITSTVVVSGSSQSMAVNTRYVVTSSSTPCTLSLPASATIGDIIEIIGASALGSMQITQASGQLVHIGSAVSTTGATGTVTSGTGLYDSIRLVCMATNTTWTSLGGPQGSWSLA